MLYHIFIFTMGFGGYMRKKKLELNKTGKLVYKLIISNTLLLISLVVLFILYIVK